MVMPFLSVLPLENSAACPEKGYRRNFIARLLASVTAGKDPHFSGVPGGFCSSCGFESRSPGERFGVNCKIYNFVVRAYGHGAGRDIVPGQMGTCPPLRRVPVCLGFFMRKTASFQ